MPTIKNQVVANFPTVADVDSDSQSLINGIITANLAANTIAADLWRANSATIGNLTVDTANTVLGLYVDNTKIANTATPGYVVATGNGTLSTQVAASIPQAQPFSPTANIQVGDLLLGYSFSGFTGPVQFGRNYAVTASGGAINIPNSIQTYIQSAPPGIYKCLGGVQRPDLVSLTNAVLWVRVA